MKMKTPSVGIDKDIEAKKKSLRIGDKMVWSIGCTATVAATYRPGRSCSDGYSCSMHHPLTSLKHHDGQVSKTKPILQFNEPQMAPGADEA